jgi:hypothetical protein
MSVFARLSAALRSDALSGSLLIAAALVALIWANSPLSNSYESLRSFRFGPAAWHLDLSVQSWAADGLLAVFFFIVGNELKQELAHGELRDPRRAVLPIVAALGGSSSRPSSSSRSTPAPGAMRSAAGASRWPQTSPSRSPYSPWRGADCPARCVRSC